MMRRPLGSALVAIALVVGACTGNTEIVPRTTNPLTISTTAAPATTTTTTTTVDESTATTTTSTTTTVPLETTTSTTGQQAAPMLALAQVTFGENAFVAVINAGMTTADTSGWWLCQAPAYLALPSVELEPGERIAVTAGSATDFELAGMVEIVGARGALGTFHARSGEVGLYFSDGGTPDFSSAFAIKDYVEWGRSGHSRSQPAIDAQLWERGGFVSTPAGTLAITATVLHTTSPDDWAVDIGG